MVASSVSRKQAVRWSITDITVTLTKIIADLNKSKFNAFQFGRLSENSVNKQLLIRQRVEAICMSVKWGNVITPHKSYYICLLKMRGCYKTQLPDVHTDKRRCANCLSQYVSKFFGAILKILCSAFS